MYTLNKFTDLAKTAAGQGRAPTPEELTGIGVDVADVPLVYGQERGTPLANLNIPGVSTAAPTPPTGSSNSSASFFSGTNNRVPAAGNYTAGAFGPLASYGANIAGGQAPQALPASGAPGSAPSGGFFGGGATAPAAGGASGGFSLSGLPNPQSSALSAIAAQFGLNNYNVGQQMAVNRVNEQNPYGFSSYVQNPDGSYSRVSGLSPQQQQLLSQQQYRDFALGQMGDNSLLQAKGAYSSPFTFDGLPAAPDAPTFQNLPGIAGMGDLAGERSRIEDMLYNDFARRIEPQMAREEEALRQRLSDQGVPVGSERWRYEMEAFTQARNDARAQARAQATQLGGDELARSFGISLDTRRQIAGEQSTAFDLGGTARDRATSEYSFLRDRPLQELSSLLSLQSGIKDPEFSPMLPISVPTIDGIGAGLGFLGNETQRYLGQLSAQTSLANAAAANALGYAQLRADQDYKDKYLALEDAKFQAGQQPTGNWYDPLLVAAANAGGQLFGAYIGGGF